MGDKILPILTRFHREIFLPDIESLVRDAVGSLEQRMNAHFDAVNARFDAIYKRFDRLDAEYQTLAASLKRVEEGLDRVEARLDGVATAAYVEVGP